MGKAKQGWDFYLSEMGKYKKKDGNLMVLDDYHICPELMSWVMKQREQFLKRMNSEISMLTQVQFEKLSSLGFTEVVKMQNEERVDNKSDDGVDEAPKLAK